MFPPTTSVNFDLKSFQIRIKNSFRHRYLSNLATKPYTATHAGETETDNQISPRNVYTPHYQLAFLVKVEDGRGL
ncbi:hypothetical protein Hanom_Chr03g00233951 [Helianthus anomalus]